MSVARLARDVLPQPWLLHHLIKHVAPRVRAEADRELQPLARRAIERRKLKRGEQPRCVMSAYRRGSRDDFTRQDPGDHRRSTLRAVTLAAPAGTPHAGQQPGSISQSHQSTCTRRPWRSSSAPANFDEAPMTALRSRA
mgnify:CR=1 FL=1